MNIIVIGLGSMGRRRIRLLKIYDPAMNIVGVDTVPERREESKNTFSIDTYDSLSEAIIFSKPEAAFICTSPLSHNNIISQCLDARLHVFSELNLVSDGYAENTAKAEQKGLKLFLSSTFLYREEISFIKNKVKSAVKPINYVYHVGQYLPDWHPWEDYSGFFVGDKRTNGCREIFAIELPWLLKTFGKVIKQTTVSSKNTKLKVEYDDNYIVIIEHDYGNKGALIVDVVSRKAVRDFVAYSEELFLTWDGSPSGLKEYEIQSKKERSISLYESVDQLDGYSAFVVENAYMNEIKAFFQYVEHDIQPVYGFEDDLVTIELIDEIEGYGK